MSKLDKAVQYVIDDGYFGPFSVRDYRHVFGYDSLPFDTLEEALEIIDRNREDLSESERTMLKKIYGSDF